MAFIFSGYTLSYRKENGDWIEIPVEPYEETHTLSKLSCGTRYHLFMTASNKAGVSEPSETLTATTSGSGTVFFLYPYTHFDFCSSNLLKFS